MTTRPTQHKINAMTQGQLIRLMLEGTYNCKELAEETGLHYVTVLSYCRALHKAGAAHVCMWDTDKRGLASIKVYRIGVGKDVPQPRRRTDVERQRKYRDNLKMRRATMVTAGVARFVLSKNGQLKFEMLETEAP